LGHSKALNKYDCTDFCRHEHLTYLQIDADGNGVADVAEATANQLAVRKCALFIKTVDPKRITEALSGLNSGALAIVATLKLEFAKSITLGSSISTMVFEGPAKTYVVPALEATMPPDYKKWAAPLVQYSVKSASISLAWFIQRVISAVHAALRGSKMCAENLLDYLTTMGFLSSALRSNLRLDLILAPGTPILLRASDLGTYLSCWI
jgi:hypothetical protein